MKKFIFGIIVVVIGAMLFGAGWNLNHNKERGFDNYQKELADRAKKIDELEDSISKLNTRLELYEQLVGWFQAEDSAAEKICLCFGIPVTIRIHYFLS